MRITLNNVRVTLILMRGIEHVISNFSAERDHCSYFKLHRYVHMCTRRRLMKYRLMHDACYTNCKIFNSIGWSRNFKLIIIATVIALILCLGDPHPVN